MSSPRLTLVPPAAPLPAASGDGRAAAAPSPALLSTMDLVARARAGDREALETICIRSLKALSRFAVGRLPRRVRGMVETQDLVAEALQRALARLHEIDVQREGALTAYLRRVLKNLIVDKLRAVDRRPVAVTLDDQQVDDTRSPLQRVLDNEKVELYELALQRLKPRDTEAIILRLEQQADYEEIAVHLGFPTGNAARVAVRRALLRLAHEMARLSRAKRGATGEGSA
jgi:RNA polymerase sigma-70 factor (ECF subfamily)